MLLLLPAAAVCCCVLLLLQAVGQLTYIRPYVTDFSPEWLFGSSMSLVAGAMALIYVAGVCMHVCQDVPQPAGYYAGLSICVTPVDLHQANQGLCAAALMRQSTLTQTATSHKFGPCLATTWWTHLNSQPT